MNYAHTPGVAAIGDPNWRRIRNRLLAASDWTQVSDNTLPKAEKDAWKAYRQALRDLSDTSTTWPTPPTRGSQ